MPERSTHIVIGVIESHHFDSYPFLRVPRTEGEWWRILRRRIRVETVLKGAEKRPSVDVYEVFWTGGATGNWNATWDGGRYLFLLQSEGRRYRVIQDWARCIFPVESGRHDRLPGKDTMPFWERFALLEYWVGPGARLRALHPWTPAFVIDDWRMAKLMRGFLRYPDREVRVAACRWLTDHGRGQDECWDALTDAEKQKLFGPRPEERFASNRRGEAQTREYWAHYMRHLPTSMSELRLLTTIRDPELRAWACQQFERQFPGDRDNGCPASAPPPATIVTAEGDVPLAGPWPGVIQ